MKQMKKVSMVALIVLITGIILYTLPVNGQDKTDDMLAFYLVSAIVGGIIVITLIYVGYKKYKYEEKKQSKKKSNS